MYRLIVLLCTFGAMLSLVSCNTEKRNQMQLLKDWMGKTIVYPDKFVYTIYGEDTVRTIKEPQFQIISYADSIGCMSCKLKLKQWKPFIEELNTYYNVSTLFVFQAEVSQETKYMLKRNNFNYPVVFDEGDSFNTLNSLPTNDEFRTFLLDKDNKVLAIGNPIYNPKIRDLYLKIIQGEGIGQEGEDKEIQTEVTIDKTSVSFGKFDWQEEQKTTFTLKNAGDKPLVIQDVTTSCGCTTVAYSKEPVRPGKETVIEVGYKAESPGYFNKTITVYCNAEISPLTLKISGNANEIRKKI